METEDSSCVESTMTPMQTDEADSDVSMATAQSCTALQTDIDDMGSPFTCVEEENKLTKHAALTPERCKQSTKASESPGDEDMAMPPLSEEKHPATNSGQEPVTMETLNILCECFYLPYEHGIYGREMVTKFKWLKETAFKLSNTMNKKTEKYLDKVLFNF